jgi:predicted Zn-dependent protease
VIFRRLLAFLALLFAVAACAGQTIPSQAAGAGQGTAQVPSMPRDLERELGSPYAAPALQAYVDRVGQRLATRAKLSGSYRFIVLDSPLANAHAVANYVFVTRGLLALLEDEAELAAAFAHEIGHLVERHGYQRAQARKSVLDSAIEATLTTGSVSVGRSVARDGLLALRRYSREQEFEADRIGVDMLVRAGYRGDAMSSLIDKLRRQGQFELQLLGEAPDAVDRRSSTSTHPGPTERRQALQFVPQASVPGDSNAEVYLAAIDNMSVDDPPREGFVRGNSFLHPVLRLGFTAPGDFRLFNESDGVLGVGRDGSLLFFSCVRARVADSLADWMRSRIKPTPTNVQTTAINGAEAAIGARPRGADSGLSQVRYVFIRHGERICYFNLTSEGPDRDRRIEALLAAARTFHTLSDADVAALRPYRLHIVPPTSGTPAQLAQRMPYRDFRMERLLVLNGVNTPADIERLRLVKIVDP